MIITNQNNIFADILLKVDGTCQNLLLVMDREREREKEKER